LCNPAIQSELEDIFVYINQPQEHVNQASSVLDCLKRKWSFIPISSIEKRPDFNILKNTTGKTEWKSYQHRRPTETEGILFTGAYGIAVITGEISNIIVLDVDVKKGNGFDSLRDKELPPTPMVRTQSGGVHYYYKYPEGLKVPSKNAILPNVDLKANGGYVVTPHTPGYEWVDSCSPEEIPYADAPSWLLELGSDVGLKKGVASNEYSLLATPPRTTTVTKRKTVSYSKYKLKDWYMKEEIAEDFLDYLNLDKKIGESFKCVLPGHNDKSPSSSIYQGNNGVYIYRDWHGGYGEQILLIPEVYASIHYGKVVSASKVLVDKEIGKSEVATWGIRYLVDRGFIRPYEVDYKELKGKVPPTAKKTYMGFVRLLECKWLYSPNEPTPFSWRFAKAWCGVSERKAGESIKWLIANGYIEQVGSTAAKGRKMALFTLKKD
jgi:hypothetical protein